MAFKNHLRERLAYSCTIFACAGCPLSPSLSSLTQRVTFRCASLMPVKPIKEGFLYPQFTNHFLPVNNYFS